MNLSNMIKRIARSYLFLLTIILLQVLLHQNSAQGQGVEVIKWKQFDVLQHSKNDTVYVINFWATWCVPCVKELPYFEELSNHYKNQKVKVILVSLDYKKQAETRVLPFLKQKNIASTVVILDEPDYNSWIDKVDPSWGGAIPATLFVGKQGANRLFYEKEFNFTELDNIVKQLLTE